ncbi:MAG TPA: Rieske 2Fe-2S domain-containing protein [Candidatus Acidoferrales bacterium]|nr:Rieske 2Fe-2S domain-containing protein [Candidatus Acidoferrales bacterium]
MLTREENEMLTRVGPGTPAGELLRRYWLPVAVAQELTEENPTQFVRILGENLVLFRDKSGRVGLLDDRCSHRGASLCYGRVEERGIACPYHGWLFDVQGNCLETPPEPPESKFRLTVKQKAYPVQKFVGLFWTYMGPAPAPLIPNYDVWARKDGTRKIFVQPQLDCNWFQAMENSVDPAHLQILHQETARDAGRTAPSTTRGFTDDVESFDFYEVPYGIMKRRRYKNGMVDEHPLIFPNILRQGNATQIRVPIDDTHTKIFFVRFFPTADGSIVEEEGDPPVIYVKPYKNPPDAIHPFTKFRMDEVQAQDHMAWETQGPIADRTRERLATSDRGIVMLREIMKREMEKVRAGKDPMGIIRDPARNGIIDTKVMESIAQMSQSRAPEARAVA